jgi:hypothetical protein
MNNHDSPNFFQDFVDAKAILKGHFKLSSGLHSDTYIQCARVLMNPVISNKFCQIMFTKYFESSQENSNSILELSKLLVKKQILFKSNLSRGILSIYNNWSDNSLDYNNATKKMKDLLTCLKNMGITKNLETILKTFKIEYIQN